MLVTARGDRVLADREEGPYPPALSRAPEFEAHPLTVHPFALLSLSQGDVIRINGNSPTYEVTEVEQMPPKPAATLRMRDGGDTRYHLRHRRVDPTGAQSPHCVVLARGRSRLAGGSGLSRITGVERITRLSEGDE